MSPFRSALLNHDDGRRRQVAAWVGAPALRRLPMRAAPVLGLALFWELIARLEVVNPLLFPAPSRVFRALLEWAHSGDLWLDVRSSCWRVLVGFVLGGASGLMAGLWTGRSRNAEAALAPLLQIFRPLPPVAIIPLIIVWLGIGESAKVFSIAFAVFFPVWLNSHLGASSIPREYVWAARILRPTRGRTLVQVLIPAMLPSALAGLRTSLAIAFVMVYVSEIAGASAGLGYRISVSHLAYRIDLMMAALAVLTSAGALADYGFSMLTRRLFPWLSPRME